MVPILSERLNQTRRKLRRTVAAHGACWVILGILVVALAAGLIDWMVHASTEMRLLFLLTLIAAAGWLAYRFLASPLRVPVRDVDIALRMERLEPALCERLSSTVEFLALAENDPLAGSAELRRHAVEQGLSAAKRANFAKVIDTAPLREIGGRLAFLVLMIAGLSVARPLDSSIALRRLVNPFGGPAWPLKTQLELVDIPKRVAKGDPFEALVRVGGVVPSRVEISYRFADGTTLSDERMTAQPNGTFRGGLESANRPFSFSIEGGDARTDWINVDVVPAPEVTQLEVALAYPAYTRLADENYPEGKGHIRAVVGTKATIAARSNKPLSAGRLLWKSGAETPAEIAGDGSSLNASFKIDATGEYRIVLDDTEGMTNAQRLPKNFRVEAIPDLAPDVNLVHPLSDMLIRPQAVLPIKALVKDDFGIHWVKLVHSVQRGSEQNGTAKETPDAADKEKTVDLGIAEGNVYTVEHSWSLGGLGLQPGMVVEMRVEAADLRDLPGPNIGKSRTVRLQVAADVDFLNQVEGQQQRIKEELERALKMQETALAQVRDLTQQAKIVGRLDRPHMEKLQSAELIQRQTQERIAGAESGIMSSVQQALDSLVNNDVKGSAANKSLEMIGAELSRLAEQHLPPINHELTQARKTAGEMDARAPNEPKDGTGSTPDPQASAELARSFESSQAHQQQVVETLSNMLEQLDKWNTVVEIANDARDLARRQSEVAGQTEKLARDTLGKSQDELKPQEKAGLAQAATRQEDLREQTHRLERKIEKQAGSIEKDDPVTADLLREAQKNIGAQNLAGMMTDAARAIAENRMGDAGQQQQALGKALGELIKSLENRREQELSRLSKLLRAAEKDLTEIRKEQQRLLRKVQEAKKETDPTKQRDELARLQQRQKELEKKANEFASRLSRLQARRATENASRAGGRMRQAGEQLEQGQGEAAEAQQEQALEDLARAEEELASTRRQVEEELAREQLARISDTLLQVHQRQVGVKEELARLEGQRKESGRWTRGQLQSLSGLSRVERFLGDETKGLKDRLDEAPVFVLVIEHAADVMHGASQRMEERDAGPETESLVDAAIADFAMLLESLRSDPNQGGEDGQGQQGNQGGEGGGGGERNGIPTEAQVKLLRGLQIQLNADTARLIKQKEAAPLTKEQEELLTKLSERQGRLADLVRELSQPQTEENDPQGGPP